MTNKWRLQFQHLSTNRTHYKLCMLAYVVIYDLLFIVIAVIDCMTFDNDRDRYERI